MTWDSENITAMDEASRFEAAAQFASAELIYRDIVARSPHFHAAWHALGLLAYRQGQTELAAQHIAQAILKNGDVALYHRNYGELCRRLKRFDEAVAAGHRAIELTPADGEAHYNLALALADLGRLSDAVISYRAALTHCPRHGLAWNNLGAALERLGDLSGAELAYANAIELNPKHAEAQNNLGAIYTRQGKLSAAITCFDAAIRARPSFVEAHCNLSGLKRYTADDAHVLVLEALAETLQVAPIDDRIHLNFALGKARDDLGDYAGAFAAYALGNALKYRQQPYDEKNADATLAEFIATFDKVYFETHLQQIVADKKRIDEQHPERTPIFIVGMPRSGTTLLEQILASHSAIFGAGELTTLNDLIIAAVGNHRASQLASRAAELSAATLHSIGENYLKHVWNNAPSTRYITDKMPANFFWIGLIKRLLPQAKIIHAVRDPMDVGLSCFARLFDDASMAFTYDQAVLGRYYRRYATLMQHWYEVLPPASILNVRYEDLVAAPEIQIRRMLDFIGLPWEAGTLNFHTNRRAVKTASLAQVRKPLYADSVGRWQHFSAQLAPLRAQVESLSDIIYER